MAHFQTKKPNSGKFWMTLEWKRFFGKTHILLFIHLKRPPYTLVGFDLTTHKQAKMILHTRPSCRGNTYLLFAVLQVFQGLAF
jgi:hypothetical protein